MESRSSSSDLGESAAGQLSQIRDTDDLPSELSREPGAHPPGSSAS